MRTILAAALRAVAAAALALAGASAVFADDLPGRVGRIADVSGRIYLATEQRADDWLDVRRNDTVTSGDSVWVAGEGRAEIDYGGGQVRLAGDTNVHFVRLDDATLALFVAQGRVIVRVRVLDAGETARVDTPNTQVALTRPGLYRLDVSDDGTRTELVVREGAATASLPTGLQQVLDGQTALVEGRDADRVDVRNGVYVDGFDTWSADRDRVYDRSRSAAYVSPQMIGYADLDGYGRWDEVPEYGPLWYPSGVAPGWAPYRHGRWSWVGGWGWTWVDDAPWGYAPFHYGRWVHYGGAWAWAPGAWVSRPLWSPAMVAWYGGSTWGYSVTFGSPVYGWVPLAWGEPFIPWWGGCSRHCWGRYNRPYAVNLAERPASPPTRFANWSAPGGITAVPGAAFTGRKPVRDHVVDLRPQLLRGAPVLSRAPAVDKPMPGRLPGVRPPSSAPLPASAFQTKPMRLPPSPNVVRSAELPVAAPPRPGRIERGAGVPVDSVGPGIRPPSRAPSQPGTWGPAQQPVPPSGGTLAREPRVPRAGESVAVPIVPSPLPRQAAPAPAVPREVVPPPRAVAPVAPTPRPVPPTPLPRSAPPGAAPPPAVAPAPIPIPRSAPPMAPPPSAAPAPAPMPRAAPPSGDGGAPPGARGGTSNRVYGPEGVGRGDAPAGGVPRAQPR